MASELYSPNPLPTGQIRLLTIFPGELGSLINGTLSIHKLGCSHAYKALSYTWGKPKFQVSIYLNNQLLHIGANLHAALTELRKEGEGIILWVDAICINQKSMEEKSVHIPFMHHVYNCAAEVIVWLGRKSEDSDEAMELVHQLANSGSIDDVFEMMSSRTIESSKSNVWRPLTQLFSRPWWTRVWVLQEVAFGRNVTVVCGSVEQPWEHFAVTALVVKKYNTDGGFYDKARPGRLEVPDSFLLAFARSYGAFAIIERFPFTLEYAIKILAAPRTATDPRDKVFAILNLVPRNEWPCEPNYGMQVQELYTKVTKHIIQRSGKLNILADCWKGDWIVTDKHLRQMFQQESIESLPSWVVDWTKLKPTSPFGGVIQVEDEKHGFSIEAWGSAAPTLEPTQNVVGQADKHLEQEVSTKTEPTSYRFEANKCLVVSCRKRTRVRDVDTHPSLSSISDTFNMTHFHAFTSFLANHLSPDADSTSDSMANLLLVFEYSLLTWNIGRISGTCFPYEDYVSWRRSGTPAPSHDFVELVWDSVQNRVLVWTEDGEFGLAPWGTRRGDWIAQIEDCHVPLALRPKEEEEKVRESQSIEGGLGCYTLLGEAFVLGPEAEEDQSQRFEEIWLL